MPLRWPPSHASATAGPFEWIFSRRCDAYTPPLIFLMRNSASRSLIPSHTIQCIVNHSAPTEDENIYTYTFLKVVLRPSTNAGSRCAHSQSEWLPRHASVTLKLIMAIICICSFPAYENFQMSLFCHSRRLYPTMHSTLICQG